MAEPGCCQGCVPANPLAVIEILADQPMKLGGGALRLRGTWHVSGESDGWRYQLRGAEVKPGITRRRLIATSPLFCLPASVMAQATDGMAVDVHSHAGNLIRESFSRGEAFSPVAGPMRQGGLSVICLAVVADSPVVRLTDGRLRPSRDPRPGELYEFSQRSFPQLHALAREQGMPIIRTASDLRAARAAQPSVIVTSEGADFLEGKIERLDEAYQRWQLRHLQLTHYRPNELGDIQTEPSVHGGLTAFGAEDSPLQPPGHRGRRGARHLRAGEGCGEGHGQAAGAVAHLAQQSPGAMDAANHLRPRPRGASTGGVIGIWPVAAYFPTMAAYAEGFARMAEVAGVDHVGLGTDLLGLVGASTLASYADLPQLAAALRGKFTAEETAKLLGGNYRRVFEASLA
jgi:membrane dipeptidase